MMDADKKTVRKEHQTFGRLLNNIDPKSLK